MPVGCNAFRTPETDELIGLRRIDIFKGVSSDTMAHLTASALLQSVPANVQLFQEGGRLEHLYVLLDGIVELYSEYGKGDFGFMLLQPPAVFISAAILMDAYCLNSARTLRDTRLVLIPAAAVRFAIEHDPSFARAFELELAQSYRRVLKELKNHKFRDVTQRLANWLLANLEPNGCGGVVRLPLSRRRLAAHLGATPETLSRILGEMARHGVSSRAQEIAVEDIAALTRLAHPDPLIDG